MAFARAALMRYGHDPRDIDAYPWRDVRLFLEALPVIHERENPLLGDGDS